MFRTLLFSVFILVSGVIVGTSQTVSGSIAGGAVTKGKAARATVVLSIPGGLHVNSSRPNSEYAIATRVTASAKGVKLTPVIYPKGVDRKFEFSESVINVYEGRPSFWFNVTVPESYTGSTIAVNVAVKYQACTNEVCYPPKTKRITLTARVK